MQSRREFLKLIGATGLAISVAKFDKSLLDIKKPTIEDSVLIIPTEADFIIDLEKCVSYETHVDNNVYIMDSRSGEFHAGSGRIEETMSVHIAADEKFQEMLRENMIKNTKVFLVSERLGTEREAIVMSCQIAGNARADRLGDLIFINPFFLEMDLDLQLLAIKT